MKKLLALLMTLALLVGVTACGSNEIPATVMGEKSFGLGSVDGLTYKNDFIGIGCNLGSDWSFYSDEQIRQMNNQTTALAGEEYEALMANTNMVYDMMAVSSNQLDNISVILEKSTEEAVAAFDLRTTYAALFPTIKQSFENMGYTGITYQFAPITIDGKTIECVTSSANYGYGIMYQRQLMLPLSGGYVATVTVTTFDNDGTEYYLQKFFWTE